MKLLKLSLAALGAIAFTTSLNATLNSEKITLKNNMQVVHTKKPASVDNLSDAFSEGVFYGRLRSNAFIWDWKNKEDHRVMGLGGSLIYKTAPLNGVSATLGGYTTINPGWYRPDISDAGIIKAGKDTFSRHRLATGGDYGMNVLAQAYLQYDFSKTSIKAGRQLFESVFTKSNDTKMIPNTFDGITLSSKDIENNTISLAYLAKQKLRDHTTSHDVIAYDGWVQNDDSAINKNLTVARVGDDNELIIASVTNQSIKNLKANLSYALVPDIFSNITLEAQYSIKADEWKIIPAIRYMQQLDHLNANYNVANLKANSAGYDDPNSLDTYLIATRVDFKKDAFMARVGYSYIADKADIIAPWRGFATGGYTRAMAQYNWYANTKTYMVRADYDFDKAGLLDGFSLMARYAIQDFDDKKPGVQADSHVLHVDARQNIGDSFQVKFRYGYSNEKAGIIDMNGATKSDNSYSEYRLELNYFF
jgi:hypothetical protein